jgi:hypothetical protein
MMHHDHTGHEAPSEGVEDQGPSFGGHGMLVVGENNVYLSHLPMFMLPHNFQAIMEVEFEGGGDPYGHYLHDRRHRGSKLNTLNPTEEFNLTDLTVDPLDRSHPQPRRSSFNAEIFHEHFERPNKAHPDAPRSFKLVDAVVQVKNVVIFRQLDTYRKAPPLLPRLEYFLFGKAQELFLAHVITQPPDFDQVLSVRVEGHEFTDEALRHGVLVTVPERPNSMVERIKEGERVVAEAQLAGEDVARAEILVEADTEFYFEEGELR